jgi:hypothetical protein
LLVLSITGFDPELPWSRVNLLKVSGEERTQGQDANNGTRHQHQEQIRRWNEAGCEVEKLYANDRDPESDTVGNGQGRPHLLGWGGGRVQRGELRRVSSDDDSPEQQEPDE